MGFGAVLVDTAVAVVVLVVVCAAAALSCTRRRRGASSQCSRFLVAAVWASLCRVAAVVAVWCGGDGVVVHACVVSMLPSFVSSYVSIATQLIRVFACTCARAVVLQRECVDRRAVCVIRVCECGCTLLHRFSARAACTTRPQVICCARIRFSIICSAVCADHHHPHSSPNYS